MSNNDNLPSHRSRLNLAELQKSAISDSKTLSTQNKDLSEESADIEVTPEFEAILNAINSGNPCMFITGKAGTGKSTLINWLNKKVTNCAIVAPTALAASNVGGTTVHSLFGLPASHIDSDTDQKISDTTEKIIKSMKCLIVDEVSMLLPNLVDVMDKMMSYVMKSDEAFGGIPTLFIGDLLQLPPVVASQAELTYFSQRYQTPYFFSADVFIKRDITPIHLSKVRRQNDPDFIEALNAIRMNSDHREHVARFNRECFLNKQEEDNEQSTYLVPTNQQALYINVERLKQIDSDTHTYEAITTGNLPATKWKINVPSTLDLKIGAKIIFLKNNKPYWINGDLGVVEQLRSDGIGVRHQKTGNLVFVGREVWEKYKYLYNYQLMSIEKTVVGTFEQFPVALGWAITIHKSQGMTLDNITLDLGSGAFCEGQTYVALSRATTMNGITLARPISMRDVQANPIVLALYKRLGLE